ncbi:phage integrase SAM-like domain and Arm DNA-binding domain-containing protein [Gaoshiqia sp. Z1-71]|uniref:phage integrase SAM-like domain and Arm DNA-binding domain-containing protein n=1 Tax=Gaoshiqia hydrogeniformans TaxID=3290090 RepID=UPI003BF7766E
MRITINLSLKNSKSHLNGKTPVYARITMAGRRAEISTGIFVDPPQWDNNRQLITGKSESATILNNRLSKFVSKVNDFYNQLVAIGDDFDITDLKERITGPKNQKQVLDLFDLTIQSVEGKLGHGYTYSTLKHYRTCRRRLEEFIREQYGRTDMALSRINYQFLDSFDLFLKSVVQVSSNTAWGYHKDFKRVLNKAVFMQLLPKNPYHSYKVKSMESNRDFLTIDELSKLMNKEIAIKRLSTVRDIFVFACSDIYLVQINYKFITDFEYFLRNYQP